MATQYAGPESAQGLARGWLLHALIWLSSLVKLLLAATVTHFVMVDDAYITLRYARNLVSHGEFVFNPGDPVLGLTTPLYGLLTAVLYAAFPDGTEVAMLVAGFLLWAGAAYAGAALVGERYRLPFVIAFLWYPTFVDNQMLGMETPLFVFLMLASALAAQRGRFSMAGLAYGLLLVTRPEAVLLAPVLLALLGLSGGRAAVRRLFTSPLALGLVAAPPALWIGYAVATYGSPIPQSALAKSGWHDAHMATTSTLTEAVLALPRLTFLPYTDRLPTALGLAASAGLLVGALWIARLGVRRRYPRSLVWLGFVGLYLAFFVLGRGKTTCSWYALPCATAFLLAAEPAMPRLAARSVALSGAGVLAVLIAVSFWTVFTRANISQLYMASYGRLADWLVENRGVGGEPVRVAIGEIGVFGHYCPCTVIDLEGLVSPQVTDLRNRRTSVATVLQETRADFMVLDRTTLEAGRYHAIGPLWSNERERGWYQASVTKLVAHRGKTLFEVQPPVAHASHRTSSGSGPVAAADLTTP